MGQRTIPRSVEDRLAQLEEWQRRLQYNDGIRSTDVRRLYSTTGDVLIAAGPADPQPLAVPPVAPNLPNEQGRWLFSVNPGTTLGVEWIFVEGIRPVQRSN